MPFHNIAASKTLSDRVFFAMNPGFERNKGMTPMFCPDLIHSVTDDFIKRNPKLSTRQIKRPLSKVLAEKLMPTVKHHDFDMDPNILADEIYEAMRGPGSAEPA